MAAFLDTFLPRVLPPGQPWKPIDHGSKQRLRARLPVRLRGYAGYDPAYRPKVLVLLDRDEDDCRLLKDELERAAAAAGLRTKSRPGPAGVFDVVSRIVVEELEAWFLGDPAAVASVWSGAARFLGKAAYRDPDAVRGGTHEAMLRVLRAAGHLRGADRLPKIAVARAMGSALNPDASRSCSFTHFRTGLDALVAMP